MRGNNKDPDDTYDSNEDTRDSDHDVDVIAGGSRENEVDAVSEQSVSEVENDESEEEDEDGNDDKTDSEVEHGSDVKEEKPDMITLQNQVFDCAFHPTNNIIGTAEITGKISLFSFDVKESNKNILAFKHHNKACRCLSFSLDGQRLYSASKDQSICCADMNTGGLIKQISNAHENPISSFKVVSDFYLASGCDEGTVKMWDTRTFSMIGEFSNRKDYISDITCDSGTRKNLLCTSGDGVLSVYNLRKKQLEKESDQLDEELTCVEIIKNGQKVVCGSANGVLNVFSWGEWGDISDRYPTKYDSIESMCAVTNDIICLGGDDGIIKAMFVHPYKSIRRLGSHGNLGIAKLKLSGDKRLMASCGNENTVKFWDVSSLLEEQLEPEELRKGVKRKHVESNDTNDFFADL